MFTRSFGCQQSVNDGEKDYGRSGGPWLRRLRRRGTGGLDCIQYLCGAEHAEHRVFGNIGALKTLKEKNPHLLIAVCGCMTQQESVVEKLKKSYPYVDIVFGTNGIDLLPRLILEN